MPAPAAILDLVARFRANLDAYKAGSTTKPSSAASSSTRSSRPSAGTSTTRRATPRPTRTSSTRTPSRSAARPRPPTTASASAARASSSSRPRSPSVNIKDDVSPAYQLRRYAWSAKLPLSILTDFEEFAVYDCRIKPDKTDKAVRRRGSCYLHLHRVRRHAGTSSPAIFSREAVLQGLVRQVSPSRQGQDAAPPRSTPPSWRRSSAGATCWPATSPCATPACRSATSNFAVQRTIDRIIFLRICEDRGIETVRHACRRCSTARDVYRAAAASSSSGPTTATTPACSTSTPRRTAHEPPDELTPEPDDRRQAAQGHHRKPLLPRQPLRVLRPARPTSSARSTSSSSAR